MFTKSVALAVALAASVTAVSIDSPGLRQCLSQTLSFSGGAAPYYVAVLPAVNPCESDSIAEFHDVYGNTVDYYVNLPQGTQVQLYVVDNDDQESWSQIITIGGSEDSSCVGGSAPPSSPPPAADPPAANPPASNPPAVNLPTVNPPTVNPPAVNPPSIPTFEDDPVDVDHVEDDVNMDDTEEQPVTEDDVPEDLETEDLTEDPVDDTGLDVEDVDDNAEGEGSTYTAPAFQPNSVPNSGTGNSGADNEEQGGGAPPPANAANGLNAGSSVLVNSGSLVVSLLAVAFALQA